MSDSIDRQKAIDTVHRMREIWNTGDIDDLEEMIVTALAELCSIQRTGRWIQIDESIKVSNYKCSECGITVCDDRGYSPYIDYPFCHCGVRMEGEG